MRCLLSAAVGGWALHGALQAAIDGRATWALVLGIIGTANLAIAIIHYRERRYA